jgi:hypothetical protein
MIKSFLEACGRACGQWFIKPAINVETDMSEKTHNTHYTINIGTVIIADEKFAEQVIKIIENADVTVGTIEEFKENKNA